MKRLLVVVDFQNDFVDGSLGFKEATMLEKRIATKIREFEDNNDEVVFTMDTHDKDYLKTVEGLNLPVEHCIEGSQGHQLHGIVKGMASKHEMFYKPTFASARLFDYLRTHSFDYIELVGLVTNICVISNAVIVKCVLPNAKLVVDASCVMSYDKELHNKALDVMSSFHIEVINR